MTRVNMEVRPVSFAERAVPRRTRDDDGSWDYELSPQSRTFLTRRGAFRWIAWGYVLRSRFYAGTLDECSGGNDEHSCHLCYSHVAERVCRLADRLSARQLRLLKRAGEVRP